jgi:hypothetical protein
MSDKNDGYLYEVQYTFLIIFRLILHIMTDVSEKVVEKKRDKFSVQWLFPRKSCRLWYNVEKYCWAGQATGDNMTNGHCMLDARYYKRTLSLNYNYCFSTAKNGCTKAPQCYFIRTYISSFVTGLATTSSKYNTKTTVLLRWFVVMETWKYYFCCSSLVVLYSAYYLCIISVHLRYICRIRTCFRFLILLQVWDTNVISQMVCRYFCVVFMYWVSQPWY